MKRVPINVTERFLKHFCLAQRPRAALPRFFLPQLGPGPAPPPLGPALGPLWGRFGAGPAAPPPFPAPPLPAPSRPRQPSSAGAAGKRGSAPPGIPREGLSPGPGRTTFPKVPRAGSLRRSWYPATSPFPLPAGKCSPAGSRSRGAGRILQGRGTPFPIILLPPRRRPRSGAILFRVPT